MKSCFLYGGLDKGSYSEEHLKERGGHNRGRSCAEVHLNQDPETLAANRLPTNVSVDVGLLFIQAVDTREIVR